MGRLEGKVALISGGARGQGAAEATMFANEGAMVVIGDVLDEAGTELEAEIRRQGGQATYVHLDVTSEEDWDRAVSLAEDRYGKLNVLVNNAGITLRRNLEETTAEDWDSVMEINAKGVFLGTRYSVPAMRRAGSGSIVNISSISGLVGMGAPAYNASKGAVRLLTKMVAMEYAKDQIRCNSVHPGSIDTLMFQSGHHDEAARAKRASQIPLGRIGTTEDVAYGVLYLASDESSYVTGSELVVDGGDTAH